MSARELVKRAKLWSSARPNGHPVETPPPIDEREPAYVEPAGEWNLWELERLARAYAGGNSVREEWAAIFRHLRQFAKSDGRLPPQFDSLVRESFPELTHG